VVSAPSELPPPVPPPQGVRETAEEVLSRPEFRQPPKSLYERATDWLEEQLDRAISLFFSGSRGSVVAWIVLLAIVGLVGFFVWRFVRTARREPRSWRARPDVTTEVRRSALDWDRDAEEHERAGRWRDAVRCRYRALAARLGSAGVVDDEDQTRTPREQRMEVDVALPPDAARSFAEAVDLFERAWYGQRPTGEGEGTRFRSLADGVLAAVGAAREER
jgi:hypothetical protein